MTHRAQAPLPVLYQDAWLVAVDKPAGQLVHPADQPREGDQVTMKILRDQLGRLVYNIHRIDRPTTGVLLFGIDRDSAKSLHRALERQEVRKSYLAIVSGSPEEARWQCREPLRKHSDAPAHDAHTSFKLLAKSTVQGEPLSLVEATPHTGRYHQIRRHLLHTGLPIVGDYRYAGVEQADRQGKTLGTGTRMLLQSKSIEFDHPATGERTCIEAPADPCFRRCFPDFFSV